MPGWKVDGADGANVAPPGSEGSSTGVGVGPQDEQPPDGTPKAGAQPPTHGSHELMQGAQLLTHGAHTLVQGAQALAQGAHPAA